MSVKKIWEFTEITSVTPINGSDVVPIGDVSASKTYKSTITNIYNYVLNLLNSVFAPIAKGVTNGDSHDHSGGDGAQIDHTTCSNIGTNSHSAIDTFIASKAGSSGLASLDSNSLVIQNPANATSTATANKIPIADSSAKLDTWITTASSSSPGKVQLATSSEAVTGTDTSKAMTPATNYQVALSRIRDTMGKFSGIIPPSLNLFCGDATSDAAPAGTFTRSTTGTRLGQAGLIETVAAGSVRREWGASGNLLGWLAEATATNLLSYSEQIDNAAWSKSNCTVTANAIASPTGGTTADKLIANATSAAHLVRAFYAFSASVNYTVSFFAKSSELSVITVRITDGNSNFGTVHINLANGTKSDGSTTIPLDTVVKDFGNGWWRISVSFSLSSVTASSYFDIVMSNVWPPTNNMGQTFAGDGASGLYLWGAQLESNPFPTSYIPTTSAAVARSADVWTVPLSTSWFNAAAGTLFVVGKTAPGLPPSGGSQVLAMFDDGTSSNRFYIWRASTGNVYFSAVVGGVATSPNMGVVSNSTALKIAVAWSSNGISAVINGAQAVASTTDSIPSLSTLRIGASSSGAGQWGGHIKHLAYFPVALSDTQLQTITL